MIARTLAKVSSAQMPALGSQSAGRRERWQAEAGGGQERAAPTALDRPNTSPTTDDRLATSRGA